MPIVSAQNDEATYDTHFDTLDAARSTIEFWDALESVWQHADLRFLTYERHIGHGGEFDVDLYRNDIATVGGYHVESLPKLVAVKTAKIAKFATTENALAGKNGMRRFAHEIRVLGHPPIRTHPRIVKWYIAAWKSERDQLPVPQLVVEYSPLGSLAHYLRTSPRLEFNQNLKLIHDMADALDSLHSCGIVHGDLKLDNIMVFPDETDGLVAKLSDFGCSSSLADPAETRVYRGTRRYCPPEVEELKQKSIPELEKCDVFALGLATWEILNDGKSYWLLDETLESQSEDQVRAKWPATKYEEVFSAWYDGQKQRFLATYGVSESNPQAVSGTVAKFMRKTVLGMIASNVESRCTALATLNLLNQV